MRASATLLALPPVYSTSSPLPPPHHPQTLTDMALSIAAVAPSAFVAPMGLSSRINVKMQEAAVEETAFSAKDLAGIAGPLGFFDPLGFCKDAPEGKVRFYREVELKHGRVAMLASLGFLVAEPFHPLWGGGIDVPSYIAFQQTPLQTFWPAVMLAISVIEVFSVFSFNSPFGGETWTIRSDYENGDFGFDPMGLKPTDEGELLAMQTKELNNGRLGMIAAAGMIFQEAFVTHAKLF